MYPMSPGVPPGGRNKAEEDACNIREQAMVLIHDIERVMGSENKN